MPSGSAPGQASSPPSSRADQLRDRTREREATSSPGDAARSDEARLAREAQSTLEGARLALLQQQQSPHESEGRGRTRAPSREQQQSLYEDAGPRPVEDARQQQTALSSARPGRAPAAAASIADGGALALAQARSRGGEGASASKTVTARSRSSSEDGLLGVVSLLDAGPSSHLAPASTRGGETAKRGETSASSERGSDTVKRGERNAASAKGAGGAGVAGRAKSN